MFFIFILYFVLNCLLQQFFMRMVAIICRTLLFMLDLCDNILLSNMVLSNQNLVLCYLRSAIHENERRKRV